MQPRVGGELRGDERLGLGDKSSAFLDPVAFPYAVGQGALGIEVLAARADVAACVAPLNDVPTMLCVRAERAFSRALGGSCQVPLGAYAVLDKGELWLRGFVATPDGKQMVRGEIRGAPGDDARLGETLAQQLLAQGAQRILAALGVLFLLWVGKRFTLQWGRLFALYLVWYSAGRIVWENIRIDPSEVFLGLRTNVWAAIAGVVIGLVIFFVQKRRHPGLEPSPYYPGREWTGGGNVQSQNTDEFVDVSAPPTSESTVDTATSTVASQ